jgi:hypothetical protein
MKKLTLLLTIFIITGCSTVPVERKFPEVPTELINTCADLKQTDQTTKISDVLKVVTDNYSQYHECRVRVDSWMEWYKTQILIFESVK